MDLNNPPDKPEARLVQMLSYQLTQMIYVVTKLGVPDALKHGPKTADELATIVNAHPRTLFRLMRALASQGVFIQDDRDTFALTGISELLCSDSKGTYAPLVLSYGESWWWGAWSGLLFSVQNGETAFDHVHGMSLFEFLAENPGAASIFNNNMTAMTTEESNAVLAAYDFSSAHLIVDVGGGQGALMNAILKVYPQANTIIYDLPAVIAGTAARLDDAGITGRCKLVSGSFFNAVPAGGDIYVLKDILHDWDDGQAILILRNVRRAAGNSARILLIERVIFPGQASASAKMMDINMLVMSGGMERTDDEYKVLLETADFKLIRIIRTATGTCIIEAQATITNPVKI